METKLLTWKGSTDGVVKGFLITDPSTSLFHIWPVSPWEKRFFLKGSFLPESDAARPHATFEAAQAAAEEYLRAWVGRNAATICRKTYGIPERDDDAGSGPAKVTITITDIGDDTVNVRVKSEGKIAPTSSAWRTAQAIIQGIKRHPDIKISPKTQADADAIAAAN